MSEYVIQQLIPFATTWLCEAAFSAMSVLKTKYRNRLDVEHDLRLCLSKITPQFQKLVETKQRILHTSVNIKLLEHVFIVI